MMEKHDLLPCPFCGSQAETAIGTREYPEAAWGEVRCTLCAASTEGYDFEGYSNFVQESSISEAVRKWNNRA